MDQGVLAALVDVLHGPTVIRRRGGCCWPARVRRSRPEGARVAFENDVLRAQAQTGKLPLDLGDGLPRTVRPQRR